MYRASILCKSNALYRYSFHKFEQFKPNFYVSTNLFKSYTSIGALNKKMCDYRKLSTIYSMFSLF